MGHESPEQPDDTRPILHADTLTRLLEVIEPGDFCRITFRDINAIDVLRSIQEKRIRAAFRIVQDDAPAPNDMAV